MICLLSMPSICSFQAAYERGSEALGGWLVWPRVCIGAWYTLWTEILT